MTKLWSTIALASVIGFLFPAPRTAAGSSGTVARADSIRLVPADSGNEVRYRVREQLAGVDFPNDAVGRTQDVTGALVLGPDGKVIPGASHFVVNVTGLTSDKNRRDGYVRRRLLVTDSFPTVLLEPTALEGLPAPLPTSGTRSLTLLGNLTVRGVTHPTTWQVEANFAPGQVTGTARTAFTFDQFGLSKPRMSFILSVEDTVHLEYDFRLVAHR